MGCFLVYPFYGSLLLIFLIKTVSRDEGSDFYHFPCPGSLHLTVVIYEKVAEEIMLAAVNYLKEKGNVITDENLDTDTGNDGSWQKRIHSSLSDNVTGVASEKAKK